ncbi:glycosyl transferase family 25 [Mesocricetibacter intestinalis]|uniref:Glycosyl transferase family 25 n=1 Tax=Mesocricetibacter intestinalis TaxID=1521930 RepID=A0A4R6V990_9PAST|nr:glycosyltransferase family 25 protein [Mesocricetibacter intestinalis]TDQ58070.1 glycosyl transferase family 25 [Mesocricetibacter intestinalis]
MSLPPIFIISLKDSPRRETIALRMQGLNIPFQFFDAVNGGELSEEQLNNVDYHFYPQRYAARHPLRRGEIGCALSHIGVYEHIVQNKINEAIILEDDAIVSHYFERIVTDALRKVPARKQIIHFYHGKAKFWPLKRKLVEGYHLVRYRYPSKHSKRTITSTTAYYLTLDGAKLLLKHAYPLRMPSDFLTGAIQMTGIRAYGVEPPCIFLSSDASEIDAIEQRS